MLKPPKQGNLQRLPGLTLMTWDKFVAVMVRAPKNHVTPRGRMGMFGLDARRLADVGFMQKPRKSTVGAETGVWVGEWTPPLTQDKYLASAPAQYEAFSRSTRLMATKVAPHVGKIIDGKKASLSGLLAVGHFAGAEGVQSWVEKPEVRAKFASTTSNFHKANGIF